ncbi:MAG: hypothetical protein FWC03_00210 [Treponema sp.]|nr:hypothetical protein [Treponema sp.]
MKKIKKRHKKERIFRTTFFLTAAFLLIFFSCGIDEYYYLEQVDERNITVTMGNIVEIIVPPVNTGRFYYFSNYSILYRIYISGNHIPSVDIMNNLSVISPDLTSDYNRFLYITDPTSSSLPSASTFRDYFELEFELLPEAGIDISNTVLSERGGKLEITFPEIDYEYPATVYNDHEVRLRRSYRPSGLLINPKPQDDPYFRNTPELNDFINAISDSNADVIVREGLSEHYAYISMYIVSMGIDSNFSQIYSKPTHIGVFKLPDAPDY